jgi:hypothetical protein
VYTYSTGLRGGDAGGGDGQKTTGDGGDDTSGVTTSGGISVDGGEGDCQERDDRDKGRSCEHSDSDMCIGFVVVKAVEVVRTVREARQRRLMRVDESVFTTDFGNLYTIDSLVYPRNLFISQAC